MRFAVYSIAVLAAAAIVYFVGTTRPVPVAGAASSTPQATAQASAQQATHQPAAPSHQAKAERNAGPTELISLKVPTMHCPVACYPSVKKTLEGKAGVQQVELAEQKVEGLIDNPVVLIKATPDFDLEQAVAALAEDGFDGAEVVQ